MKKLSPGVLVARYVGVSLLFWMIAFTGPIFVAAMMVGHCPQVQCRIAGDQAFRRGIAVSMIFYLYMLWRCHRAWRASE